MTEDQLRAHHNGDRPAQRHAGPEKHAEECRAFIGLVMLHSGRWPFLRRLHRLENRHRDIQTARMLKAEGALPGVPDFFLPYPGGEFSGLYLEMKTAGDGLSPEQREFLSQASAAGFRAVVAWGAEQAWRAVEEYCLLAAESTMRPPAIEVFKP